MEKPKLILDTSVCGKIVVSKNKDAIRRRLHRDYRLVVSPNTLAELSDAIQGGDGSHFESDRERLRVAAGNGIPIFVEWPVTFALKHILKLPHPPKMPRAKEFEQWFRVILRAKDRDGLFAGTVRRPLLGRNYRQGFDPQVVRRQQEKGETAHVERLKAVSHKNESPPSPETWAAEMAKMLGFDLTPEQKVVFAKDLDAAYRYDVFLWKAATAPNNSYDFNKHKNDWIDAQQLFYLCDPDIRLLVEDKTLASRSMGSPQMCQVVRFKDYLKQHGLSL